jgi:hypothetical protein
LILLIPPHPFRNSTITVDNYVAKLLTSEQGALSNLLFSSIIASTSENAINKILELNKVDWTIEKLTTHTDTCWT